MGLENQDITPLNHSPEDLAIWLFGACCGDNDRFAQLRLLGRRAMMNAVEMYEEEETDPFHILETISRFNAKLDEMSRQQKEDDKNV